MPNLSRCQLTKKPCDQAENRTILQKYVKMTRKNAPISLIFDKKERKRNGSVPFPVPGKIEHPFLPRSFLNLGDPFLPRSSKKGTRSGTRSF